MVRNHVCVLVNRLGQEAIIRNHELVAVECVFVPVVQAKRFPAPVQVVVVGLVVLVSESHPRIVDGVQVPVSLAVVLQGFLGNLAHAFIVERSVVLAQASKCQPGLEYHLIKGKAAIAAEETEFGNVAVEVAQCPIFPHQGNRHHPAHQHLEWDLGLVRQHLDAEAETARNFLVSEELVRQQDRKWPILQRKVQPHQAIVLRGAAKCRPRSTGLDLMAFTH